MRAPIPVLVSLFAFSGGLPPVMAADPPADDAGVVALDDIGTRLQFAFYAGDAAALRRDLERLAALEVPDSLAALRQAYAGYGAWKLAETLRTGDTDAAATAARSCTEQLEAAVIREPQRPALFAMLSVCQRLVGELAGRIKAPFATGRSRQSLERALKLGPKDPHALLAAGLNEYEQRRVARESLEPARVQLAAAVAAFDGRYPAGATNDVFANALDWGQAEAWATLGRVQLELRDAVAARDSFEHALVLVEDYREVRELLQQITGQRLP